MRDLRARGFAVAALDWRGQGLSDRALGDRHKGYVRDFSEYDIDLETFMREIVLPDCPPPMFALGHSTGATVLIRAAYRGHRWFDRMVLTAPLIALVRSRRRRRPRGSSCARCGSTGFGGMYVPGGEAGVMETRPFAGNILDVRSRALCAQRRGARGGARARRSARPTVAWVDAAFRAMRTMQERGYPARIRQPMLIVAGRLRRCGVECRDRGFRHACCATGSHLVVVGAQHELLMEQDRFRSQFWAAFDAFVPGTPLFL